MKVKIIVDIDEDQLFKELAKALDIEFALDEDFVNTLELVWDPNIEQTVIYKDGEFFDERGDMLAAFCYLATSNYPNLSYRRNYQDLYNKAYHLDKEDISNEEN